MTAPLLSVLMLFLFGADGAEDGRRGNALYQQEQYAEAALAYRAGLETHDGSASTVAAALWNNLGAALYQQEKYAEAHDAFQRAIGTAATPEQRAKAYYNAANNAVAREERETALELYRQALLLDPNFADARFNYEFVMRNQQPPSEQSQPPPDIEPSPFAKRLKQQADSLAARRQYERAFQLMQQGLQQDTTVAAFQTFIGRLRAVADIDTLNAPTP